MARSRKAKTVKAHFRELPDDDSPAIPVIPKVATGKTHDSYGNPYESGGQVISPRAMVVGQSHDAYGNAYDGSGRSNNPGTRTHDAYGNLYNRNPTVVEAMAITTPIDDYDYDALLADALAGDE